MIRAHVAHSTRPLPFQCSITPRSSRHAQVVKREMEDAQEGLRLYE
jgi:hypothetical protein